MPLGAQRGRLLQPARISKHGMIKVQSRPHCWRVLGRRISHSLGRWQQAVRARTRVKCSLRTFRSSYQDRFLHDHRSESQQDSFTRYLHDSPANHGSLTLRLSQIESGKSIPMTTPPSATINSQAPIAAGNITVSPARSRIDSSPLASVALPWGTVMM